MKKILSIILTVFIVLTVFALSVAAENEPSPIAVFDFEDSTNLGNDISGNKNSLATKGSVKSIENGKYGKGVSFDYAGALVASADSKGKDFVDKIELDGSKRFTIMYWIKYSENDFENWDSSNGWRRVISNGVDGSTGFGGFSMLSLADNIVVPSSVNPAVVFHTESAQTSSVGNWSTYQWTTEWTNIAWTCDLTTGRCLFYVNGTAIFDLTTAELTKGGGLSNLFRNFAIGANYFSDEQGLDVFNQSYAGSIDDMYIFDTILDEKQIAFYMNNNYTKPQEDAPPTADFTVAVVFIATLGGAVLCLTHKKRKSVF